MGFVRQWDAKNLQDFVGWTLQLHIMLDNIHETVSDNRNTDLYANSILGRAPKSLNLEMLLEPFEEQFDQPSFLIEIGYI